MAESGRPIYDLPVVSSEYDVLQFPVDQNNVAKRVYATDLADYFKNTVILENTIQNMDLSVSLTAGEIYDLVKDGQIVLFDSGFLESNSTVSCLFPIHRVEKNGNDYTAFVYVQNELDDEITEYAIDRYGNVTVTDTYDFSNPNRDTTYDGSNRLILDYTPTENTQAVNKAYVDSVAGSSGGGAVYSVNGMTGDVALTASDVGALPSTYTAPVTSVNGMTGDVVVSGGGGAVDSVNGQTGVVVLDAEDVGALPDDTVIPTKTSDLTNDSGFITSADIPAQSVTSVNGQTGVVVLDADDVGALADDVGVVRYDQAQTLTEGQKTQARANIGVSNAPDKFDVFFGTNPNSTTVHIVKGNSVQVTGQEIKDHITVSQGGCILVVTDDQNSSHFVVYDLDDYTTSGAVVFYRIADGYRYTITVPLNSNVGTKAKVSLASGGGSVAYDTTQSLTEAQMRTARRNIGMPGYAVPLYYSLYSGQQSAGVLYKINVDGTHESSPMTFSDLYKLYSDDKCFIFAYEDGGNVYKLKTITTSGLTLNMIDGSTEYLLWMDAGSAGTSSTVVGVNKTTVSIGGGTSAKYRVQVSENSGVYSLASGITPSAILSNIDNVVLVQNGFYELSGYFSSPPFFTVIFAMVQVNASSGLDVTTFTLNMDVSEETCTIDKRTVTLTNSGGTATKADLTYTYNNTTNKVVSDLVGSVVTGDNIMTAYSMYGASPVVMRNGNYYHLYSASSAAVEFRRLDNTRKIIVDRWSTTASESAV